MLKQSQHNITARLHNSLVDVVRMQYLRWWPLPIGKQLHHGPVCKSGRPCWVRLLSPLDLYKSIALISLIMLLRPTLHMPSTAVGVRKSLFRHSLPLVLSVLVQNSSCSYECCKIICHLMTCMYVEGWEMMGGHSAERCIIQSTMGSTA